MEVFRISRSAYAHQLTASGKSARWNKDNEYVLYTGSSRSLSTLELVVHRGSMTTAVPYEMMVISLGVDEKLYTQLKIADLPANWRSAAAYPELQEYGSAWYTGNRSLILKVPSVIISQEYNYIINTRHPDFSDPNVVHVRNEPYFWDERLS